MNIVSRFDIKFVLISVNAQEVQLSVSWSDKSSLDVQCSVNRVYPEPTVKLFLAGLEPKTTKYAINRYISYGFENTVCFKIIRHS